MEDFRQVILYGTGQELQRSMTLYVDADSRDREPRDLAGGTPAGPVACYGMPALKQLGAPL